MPATNLWTVGGNSARWRVRVAPRVGGFTLIEVLVALGVISLLAALLLPAIGRAREAARRGACASNLRQIGAALQAYDGAFGVYPPGLFWSQPGTGWIHHYSMQTQLLPYLEQPALYDSINFQMRAFGEWRLDLAPNETVIRTSIATFLCPSDAGGRIGDWGNNSYRANYGTEMALSPNPNDGAFVSGAALQTAAHLDGLSQTVAFSEKIRGDGDSSRFLAWGDWMNAFPLGASPPVGAAALIQVCGRPVPAVPNHFSDSGAAWFYSSTRYTLYTHDLPPNHTVPDCGFDGFHPPDGLFTARSFHSSGVNALVLDGGVRFVGQSIDRGVWKSLGTRAGGEAATDQP